MHVLTIFQFCFPGLKTRYAQSSLGPCSDCARDKDQFMLLCSDGATERHRRKLFHDSGKLIVASNAFDMSGLDGTCRIHVNGLAFGYYD